MKSELSHKDSATRENGCCCLSNRGMDDPSPFCDPPGASSPLDRGLGGAFHAARLTPASVNCLQHPDPRPCELGRSEYHRHRLGLVYQSNSGASKVPEWSS
jgi:hypothetical protein